jgi:CMP-N,N'-diacetyllegionaminic acid synthase
VETATIDACLKEVQVEGCMGCITARPSAEPPAWLFKKDAEGFASPWLEGEVRGEREHTQFLEKLYIPTGAVYANRVDVIRTQRTHIGRPLRFVMMERERAVDIDDEFDFVMAEALGRHHGFTLTSLPSR